ncbi:MAG: hypothetical protein J6B75_04760 [Ruminococcus sp.]|nr:hypothetical protein [Ruminococcus sp.]
MKEYININRFDDCIDLAFYIDMEKVMSVGRKLEEINENAYMNGENWGILLDFYIEKNAPELIDTYEPDPEAGMYSAMFENSPEGEKAAQAMADIMISLVEDENKLIDFVSEFGDEIEWD